MKKIYIVLSQSYSMLAKTIKLFTKDNIHIFQFHLMKIVQICIL